MRKRQTILRGGRRHAGTDANLSKPAMTGSGGQF
jgi:hypothetical protein